MIIILLLFTINPILKHYHGIINTIFCILYPQAGVKYVSLPQVGVITKFN